MNDGFYIMSAIPSLRIEEESVVKVVTVHTSQRVYGWEVQSWTVKDLMKEGATFTPLFPLTAELLDALKTAKAVLATGKSRGWTVAGAAHAKLEKALKPLNLPEMEDQR